MEKVKLNGSIHIHMYKSVCAPTNTCTIILQIYTYKNTCENNERKENYDCEDAK